jgi:hypothetical protein
MDTVTPRYCENCNTALHGDFCHQCGQEKKNYIRNVSGVVTEFFGEFSNWDTRLWRTLVPLWFRPGYLSRRYVGGHRVPFVPPMRLYLFTSIIAFLIFAKLLPETPVNVNSKLLQETSANVSAPDNVLVQPTDNALPNSKNFADLATEIKKDFQESREKAPSEEVRVSFLSDARV